jgi:hypothetical protein
MTPERHLTLRREAYWLSGALFVALLDCADDARCARLKRLQWRAECRYWRRHEAAFPPGNQTPPWLYATAKGGY